MEMHHKNCLVGREGLEPSKMSSNHLSYLPIFNNRRCMGFDMFPHASYEHFCVYPVGESESGQDPVTIPSLSTACKGTPNPISLAILILLKYFAFLLDLRLCALALRFCIFCSLVILLLITLQIYEILSE